MDTPRNLEDDVSMSCMCGMDVLALVWRRFSSWLPRRRHEPTGPIDVIMDLLLGLVVPRGASKTDIDAIPTATISSTSDGLCNDKCAICLGPFEFGDVVRNLSCCHDFHTEVRCTYFSFCRSCCVYVHRTSLADWLLYMHAGHSMHLASARFVYIHR